ncbi:MAG: ubiA [Verrucomicrobiaceae bacterium]|nr:ubiA [Verrucomicrobiaceae bacterium]
MPSWVIYAVLSAVFAGLTSVVAKSGMKEISADLGLAVRTSVVLALVLVNVFLWKGVRDLSVITPRSWLFLVISGAATTLSWVCYYRAMKDGPVSYVATIDKGSILVTLLLSFAFLGEPLTAKLLLGAALVTSGLVILAWK